MARSTRTRMQVLLSDVVVWHSLTPYAVGHSHRGAHRSQRKKDVKNTPAWRRRWAPSCLYSNTGQVGRQMASQQSVKHIPPYGT